MKPRVFIGSSKEGISIANIVKEYFETEYECFLWTDDIFKYNDNFLETLMKEASLFDFGFMIFTKDDIIKSRGVSTTTARDNVIFEYGLFLGRLGRDKAYVIKDVNIKLPTDLLGISLADFDSDNLNESLTKSLKKLKLEIQEKVNLGLLGMLPSTVLAIGYYYNFVELVGEYLASEIEIEVEGVKFKKARLHIIIPKDLDSDLKKKAKIYYKKNLFKELQIETPHRKYPLFVSVNTENDSLILSDMPTTLNGIDKAIEMYLRVGHIGKTNEQQLLEDRELRNFEMVLRKLIENDSYSKEYVRIEIEK